MKTKEKIDGAELYIADDDESLFSALGDIDQDPEFETIPDDSVVYYHNPILEPISDESNPDGTITQIELTGVLAQ